MKERPILFIPEMVRAILDGRKTMTRRIIKPQPDEDGLWDDNKYPRSIQSTLKNWNGQTEEGESREWKCPYGEVGDKLYVKETYSKRLVSWFDLHTQTEKTSIEITYKADNPLANIHWKSSLFMPKSAARIWLEITGVRVERLQDISENGAIQEGVTTVSKLDAVWDFKRLWQSIHSLESWELNPFVWVIEFKRIKP